MLMHQTQNSPSLRLREDFHLSKNTSLQLFDQRLDPKKVLKSAKKETGILELGESQPYFLGIGQFLLDYTTNFDGSARKIPSLGLILLYFYYNCTKTLFCP